MEEPEDGTHCGGFTAGDIEVLLEDESVWSRFHSAGTEMIVTPRGRRMFPWCRFRLSGLDPNCRYFLLMDVVPSDDFRHRWTGGSWEPDGPAEPHVQGPLCFHPESPALGQRWMDGPVSFYKVKLTQDTLAQDSCVALRPMHRYQPRLHVVPVSAGNKRTLLLDGPDVRMFTFTKTEFYAVTRYQNPKVTQLKTECNPFMLAFREDGQNSCLVPNNLRRAVTDRCQSQFPVQAAVNHSCHTEHVSSGSENHSSTHTHDNSESDKEERLLSDRKRSTCDQTNHCQQKLLKRFRREDSVPEEHVTLDCEQTEDLNPHEVSPGSSEAHRSTRRTESSEDVIARANSVSAIKPSVMPSSLHRKKVISSHQKSAAPLSTTSNTRSFYCRSKRLRKARKAKSKRWSNVKYARTAAPFSPADVSMQPDLENVDGTLFVSFAVKEALDIHVVNMRSSMEPSSVTHSQTENSQCDKEGLSPLEDIISKQELILLQHLKQQKNRQIIHPLLQDVGLKLNLLDPAVSIDLQYLGVCLASSALRDVDNLPVSSNVPSQSRKTDGPTKFKSWKENQSSVDSSIIHSAFVSDMLDQYLESEAQKICERAAVFSTSSPSPVVYQLPVSSSSYVRTLDSVLHTRGVNVPAPSADSRSLPHVPAKPAVQMALIPSSGRSRQTTPITEDERLKPRTSLLSEERHPLVSSSVCSRQGVKNRSGRHLNCSRISGCGVMRSVTPAKKQMELLVQEQDALFHGKSRTCVTAERAEFALNSLLTSEESDRTAFRAHHVNEEFCGNDFCRLGCVCGSLNRTIRGPTHCRRIQCMFGCSCFKHRVFLIHPPKIDQMNHVGKMPLIAFPIADPELNRRPDPPPTVTTLWKRRSADDPETVCTPETAPVRRAAVRSRVYVPRPNPDVQEMKKDLVYMYLESKMTCARVREYNSNPPPQVHIFPAKKKVQGPDVTTNKASRQLPAHLLSQSPEKNPAVNAGEPEPTAVLEILSECNWEAHRTLVLKELFHSIDMGLLSSSIFINIYKVELLSTTLQKNKGSCTINYKVCVSLSKTSGTTDEPSREGNRQRVAAEPIRLNGSAVQRVHRPGDKQSNDELSISNNHTETKSPEPFPLLSGVLPAGRLKASKKTAACPRPIQVNGKTYAQAKLFLGQMGSLHPANRLAAYVTGRLKLMTQIQTNGRLVSETLPVRIPANLRYTQPPVIPMAPDDTRRAQSLATPQNVPSSTPNYITSSNLRLIPSVFPICVTPPKPAANLNLVSPPNPEAPAKADVVLPAAALPPGQQVVLQPVPGVKGANICQFNGQMIQLVPLPAVLPNQLQTSSSTKGKTQQEPQTPSVQLPQMIQSTVKPPEPAPSPIAIHRPSPFIAPNILSLPGITGLSFTSGTTTHALQNSFPGKAGTFSFRICPPTGDQTAHLRESGETAPTVLLPGGYRLIKLPMSGNPPCVEFINTGNTPSASVPSHLRNKCTETLIDSSKDKSQVCETVSLLSVPESAYYDSIQTAGVCTDGQASIQKSPITVNNAEGRSEIAAGTLACDPMLRGGDSTLRHDCDFSINSNRETEGGLFLRDSAQMNTSPTLGAAGSDHLDAVPSHEEHSRETLLSHRRTCRDGLPPEPDAEQKDHCPEENTALLNALSSSHGKVTNEGPMRHESPVPIKTEPSEIPIQPEHGSVPKDDPQDFIKIEPYNDSTETSSRRHCVTEQALSPVYKADPFDNPPNTDTFICTQPDDTEQCNDPDQSFVVIKIETCDETSETDLTTSHPDISESLQNPVNSSLLSIKDSPPNYSNTDEQVQSPQNNSVILKTKDSSYDPISCAIFKQPMSLKETCNEPVQTNISSLVPDTPSDAQQDSEDSKGQICKWLFKEMQQAVNSGVKDTEEPTDDCNSSVESSSRLLCSSDGWSTEDSNENSKEEEIDIETFEENNEKMNISQFRANAGGTEKEAAQNRQLRDEWGTFQVDPDAVEYKSNLCVYKRAWLLNHAARRRKRRVELQQHFDSLKRILNIEEHIEMSAQDILHQARHVIGGLEHRGRSLMEKKKSLIQKQSSYVSLVSQLSAAGTVYQTQKSTTEAASHNRSVAERPSGLPRIVLQAFTQN